MQRKIIVVVVVLAVLAVLATLALLLDREPGLEPTAGIDRPKVTTGRPEPQPAVEPA